MEKFVRASGVAGRGRLGGRCPKDFAPLLHGVGRADMDELRAWEGRNILNRHL